MLTVGERQEIQYNLVNTNTVNMNFQIIRTNIYKNSGPYSGISNDIPSVKSIIFVHAMAT